VLASGLLTGYLFCQKSEQPQAQQDANRPQRLDAWTIIGPGGGGTFYHPAISPVDPNLVLATSDMTDSFLSEDGGRTWRELNLRTAAQFYFDYKLKDRIWACTGAGSYLSDDRGRTWKLFYPDPSSVEAVWYLDDEAEPNLTTADGMVPGMSAFAVDPDDSNTIYWVASETLWVSHDMGKHSRDLVSGVPARAMVVDPASPKNRRTILFEENTNVVTWDGKSLRAGPSPGTSWFYDIAYGYLPDGGHPVIYLATDYISRGETATGGGIVASRDGGLTWQPVSLPLLNLVEKGTTPEFKAVATSRRHPEVIYAAYYHLNLPGDSKQYFGVAKTTDSGAHWSLVWKESDVSAPNLHDSWISRRFGPDWGEQPLNMTVDDNNPDIVYTTDYGRIMRTVDGGANWEPLYSTGGPESYTTTGLDPSTCYGVHFDPFDPQHMFISYTDIGLFRSDDGGKSWRSATTHGVPRAWLNTTYWMEFDPAVRGRMWAAMSTNHDLPRWRTIKDPGKTKGFRGGVVRSDDGGETWTPSSGGLPEMAATHILLDPRSTPQARVLYVTGMGRGVFKSEDGGKTWVAKSNGLPAGEPLTWRMAMDRNGVLYVVTIRRSQDGKYGNDQDGWLFRSVDGANTWERMPLPAGLNGPMGITVDPDDPSRLYLSAWGRYVAYTPVLAEQGGVFASTDAGMHWTNILNASRRIYDVTIDPKQHNVIYATGFEASAYRSADRGKSWIRLQGFNFKHGHRVIPDPVDASKVYITTFGSSVWHGPAEGDPKAVEDIAWPRLVTFEIPGGGIPKGQGRVKK